ncbi:MAG: EamA family transporter [Pseudomonadota bacterium]
MLWFVYALMAAVLWGVSYTLVEVLMKNISVASVYLYSTLSGFLFALCYGLATGAFRQDWQNIRGFSAETKTFLTGVVAVELVVYVLANLFILLSIKGKNATMAGMVEISYPLFTAFFAWALFREVQFTAGALLGVLLVLTGVACIYYFGKTV